MHYYQTDIVFQEVPGEISLCFFICGCTLRCPGCHSWHTWREEAGKPLTEALFLAQLDRYQGSLSSVLFMGGEWHESALCRYLDLAIERGLKTCLYTGRETVSDNLLRRLTYLKTGPWRQDLGGLDQPNTNQRFIEVTSGQCLNDHFQRKYIAV